MARGKRIPIQITAQTERSLILWGERRGGMTKTQMAAFVLAIRSEQQESENDRWLEAKAKRLGRPVEEVERAILAKNGFDFDREIEELGKEEAEEDD